MVIPSVFELERIKDQLALLTVLTSHINWDKYNEEGLTESSLKDYEILLSKMDTTIKNLKDRKEKLEKTLEG